MLRRGLNEDKARLELPSNFDGRIRAKDISSSKLRLERSQLRNGTNVSRLGISISNDSTENKSVRSKSYDQSQKFE